MDSDELINRAESLVEEARSDSVTVSHLTNGANKLLGVGFTNEPVLSYLFEEEQPHYIGGLQTGTKLNISGPEGTEEVKSEKYGGTGWFVVTNMRVLILVNAPEQDDVISIPLSLLNDNPDSNDQGVNLINERFKLRTTILRMNTDNYSYELPKPGGISDDALKYIRTESGVNQSELEEVHYFAAKETVFMCKKCKQEVSENAKKCPHCGYYPGKGGKGALWHLSSVFVWPMAVKGAADEIRTRRGIAEERTVVSEDSSIEVDEPYDPIGKIERLSELYDKGIISEKEFEQKKGELLDEI